MFLLNDFSLRRPRFEIEQGRALDWLARAHTLSEATLRGLDEGGRERFESSYRKLLERCACGPDRVSKRGHMLADLGSFEWPSHELYDVRRFPQGRGTAARSERFAELVNRYFEQEYREIDRAPSALVHVTCTGYASPSGAQRLVAQKGWGTHVSHAYHMGCYAALPALNQAAGHLVVPSSFVPAGSERRADIVHTELCTLHLDPSQHSAEQCVVQSLFADGLIRYSLREARQGDGLEVLALSEHVVPESAESMAWIAADHGMQMTLGRDVPERIGAELRSFVSRLFEKSGLGLAELGSAVVAVHPGGPRIIDAVRDRLELSEPQVRASREVLFDYGNMSSATLPHIWMRLLADPAVPAGALIASLAFGPGLTLCGGLFRKHT